MAQTTTNYGLLKPESTDSYNHLIYDNPNMDTIDAAMKANADAAITSATCIKSGTTHTITRSNTSAAVMKFTATGDWNSGDTMIIDGVTVSPYLMTGEALKTGAYLINSEVIIALSGTRATVLSNQSEAGTTYFDDSNVSYTANNVQDAIDAASTAAGTEYVTGVSVKDKLDTTSATASYTNTKCNTGYTLTCKRNGNVVNISGILLAIAAISANEVLATIPAEFTPTNNYAYFTTINNGVIQMRSNGELRVADMSDIIQAGNYYPINITFII